MMMKRERWENLEDTSGLHRLESGEVVHRVPISGVVFQVETLREAQLLSAEDHFEVHPNFHRFRLIKMGILDRQHSQLLAQQLTSTLPTSPHVKGKNKPALSALPGTKEFVNLVSSCKIL